MPDDTNPPSSGTPPSGGFGQRVGTGLAGETTRSMADTPGTGGERISGGESRPLEVVGDFTVIGKLGQGGMGAVYRALQVSLNRQVALKILPATFAADAEFVSRFQREARIAASLTHANLVRIYSSGQVDGCHYIAMELIEGETLAGWLRRGAIPPIEALRITLDVARALECGWQRAQLIHRDIKPGNIFLSEEGAVKLGDLGLAKTMSGDSTGLTQTGAAMGTPHYISPEQARGDKELDFRADIYSLGCTLYQMLTGRTPYDGRDPVAVFHQHIHGPPPAILKVLPQCPIPLARLVGKMFKKQRRERHASYEELIAQIESVQALFAPTDSPLAAARPSDSGVRPQPAPASSAVPRTSRSAAPASAPVVSSPKSKLPLYGGIGAGALALGIGAFLVWPKGEKLTKAQLYAKEHAGGPPLVEAATPGKSVSTATDPSAIRLWDTPAKIPPSPKAHWENNATRLDGQALREKVAMRDVDLRANVLMNPGVENPQLHLRIHDSAGGGGRSDFYSFGLSADLKSLVLSVTSDGQGKVLKTWPLSRPPGPDQWLPLELRIVGDELTASADGRTLGTVRDATVPDAGDVAVYAAKAGYFRDIAFVPLGMRSAAAPAAPEAGAIPLWDTVEKIDQKKGVSWENGVLHIDHSDMRYMTTISRDGILRASIRMNPDHESPQMGMRYSTMADGGGFYRLSVNAKGGDLSLSTVHLGKTIFLRHWHLSRAYGPDEWLRLELRAIGDEVTVTADGQVLGTVHDTSQPGVGGVMVYATANGYFRDVVFVPLDIPGGVAVKGYPQPARWIDAGPYLRKEYLARGELVADGDWLVATADKTMTLAGNASFRNPIIRILFSERVDFASRRGRKDKGDTRYLAGIRQGPPGIGLFDANETHWFDTHRQAPLPGRLDGEHEGVFATQGDTLTLWLDGKLLATVHDSTLSAGAIAIALTKGSPMGDGRIKKVEYGELPDAAPIFATVSSPAALPAVGWLPIITDLPTITTQKGVTLLPDGWVRLDNAYLHGPSQQDVALRTRLRFNGTEAWALKVRERGSAGEAYTVAVSADGAAVSLRKRALTAADDTVVKKAPLPAKLAIGQEYELAIAAMGDDLTVYVNGQPLIHERDADYNGTGTTVGAKSFAEFKDPQWLSLRAPAAVNSPPAESWQDAFGASRKILVAGAAERTPDGLRFTNGGSAMLPRPGGSQHDGAVRMRVVFGSPPVEVRIRASAAGLYQLYAGDGKQITLRRWDNIAQHAIELLRFPLPEPLQQGQEYDLELRAVGQTLTAKFNGEVIGTTTDTVLPEGSFGVGVSEKKAGGALVKTFELLDLDAPNGTGASSAPAP